MYDGLYRTLFGLAVTGTALLLCWEAFDADIEKRSCGLCTACICAELVARLTGNSWARRCIKAVAGLYILVVLLQVIPQLRTEVQSFSVPDLSPASMGTLEDAIRAELDARSSGQEAKEGNLSG